MRENSFHNINFTFLTTRVTAPPSDGTKNFGIIVFSAKNYVQDLSFQIDLSGT
jgi:hypothetical protein